MGTQIIGISMEESIMDAGGCFPESMTASESSLCQVCHIMLPGEAYAIYCKRITIAQLGERRAPDCRFDPHPG